MTSTDELRRLLDERGVEYEAEDMQTNMQTYWGDWCFMEPLDAKPHTLGAQCELTCIPATPEQAIAATLGNETCEIYRVGNTQDLRKCSACGGLMHFSHPLDRSHLNYCPNCGRKVVER